MIAKQKAVLRRMLYRRFGKRLFDAAASAAGLALLSPVLAGVGLAVRIRHGAPILFEQRRPGLGGEPFTIYKFRTMTDARDDEGRLLSDAERLTRLGRLLRSTSLDELPELWNVLKGEMSLVGPRPLMTQYLGRYTPEQARRHDVRPGITGWAQVNGRNATTWAERLAQDAWYVDNVSLRLDLKILARTLLSVALRRGISAEGHATMPEFVGRAAEKEAAEEEAALAEQLDPTEAQA